LLRRVFRWALQKAESGAQRDLVGVGGAGSQNAARRLVRDPLCGMHVDETLSIPYRDGSDLMHFCSIACRDAYAGNTKKFVANA